MKVQSLILIILFVLAILFASSLKSYLPEKLNLEKVEKYSETRRDR